MFITNRFFISYKILWLWFVLILISCNLGTAPNNQPPTLAPRVTATPLATLGYIGSGNNVLEVPSNIMTPIATIDVELNNLMQQVDIGRIRTHIETLQSFTTRHVNSSVTLSDYGIGAARTYIFNEFSNIQQQSNGRFVASALPFNISWDNFTTSQQNIVGVLNGTGPNAGFLVVGAHYDSINIDSSDSVGFAPGANDNASGVAGLIEIARILSQHQFRSSIIFVAFSAEEVGRLGSQAFVEWSVQEELDIIGMINIDSIGNSNNSSGIIDESSLRIFSCTDENICRDRGLSRQMARSTELISFALKSPLEMIVENQADRDGRYGDHFSFSEAGYPAIRIINTLEEFGNGSIQDTSDKIEYSFLLKSVQSILLMTIVNADSLPPPQNITLRITDEQPTLVWEAVPNATGYIIALRLAGSSRYDHLVEWNTTTVASFQALENDQYIGLAISVVGSGGQIGRLSNEYSLIDIR